MAVGWCVAATVVALVGCGVEKSRNPLSPSIAGPIEGVVISAPILVTSTNGQLIRATEQPITLGFSAAMSNSERPFWYEIEVSTSDVFDALTHTADQVSPSGGEAESYEIPELAADQRYVWRVRALDGANTGPYSEVAAFEVYTPVTVGRPRRVSPVSDAQVDDTSARLTVHNATVTGPAQNVRYEFQWATDADLAEGVESATVPAGDATTSTTIRELEFETRYFWRSRALADGREATPIAGEWSQTESFMTAAVHHPRHHHPRHHRASAVRRRIASRSCWPSSTPQAICTERTSSNLHSGSRSVLRPRMAIGGVD